MAELTISADEIRSAIQSYVTEYSPDVSREEVGIVTEAGDGIARVEGLPSVMTNELLEFESGVRGLARGGARAAPNPRGSTPAPPRSPPRAAAARPSCTRTCARSAATFR